MFTGGSLVSLLPGALNPYYPPSHNFLLFSLSYNLKKKNKNTMYQIRVRTIPWKLHYKNIT